MRITVPLFVIFGFLFSITSVHALPLEKIKLPNGFKISTYSAAVPGARSMTWGKDGTLFVGSKDEGKVYAIDKTRKVHVIAKGLDSPNGVAYKDGNLYVAEIHRILEFSNIDQQLAKTPEYKVVTDKYPKEGHHGWKFIAFSPTSELMVPVGAPCNICDKSDPYNSITSLDLKSKEFRVIARGIRNTVGFAWHPTTKELWFTENGRDMLGDDMPPDELNRVSKEGQHFGYPYCHAGDISDPQFGQNKKCSDYVAPVQKLAPHTAALGMRFYTGKQFPAEYQNQIFIAEHGSWNRSQKIGYRVTMVTIDASGKAKDYKTFAEGWESNGDVWGRPVDVIVAEDGSLLVSDDKAGAVYQISYTRK